jgi:hypothetical protein
VAEPANHWRDVTGVARTVRDVDVSLRGCVLLAVNKSKSSVPVSGSCSLLLFDLWMWFSSEKVTAHYKSRPQRTQVMLNEVVRLLGPVSA